MKYMERDIFPSSMQMTFDIHVIYDDGINCEITVKLYEQPYIVLIFDIHVVNGLPYAHAL